MFLSNPTASYTDVSGLGSLHSARLADRKNSNWGVHLKHVSLLAAVLVAAAITTAAAFGAAGTKTDGLPTIDVAMTGSSITVSGNLESGAVDIHATATGNPSGSPLFIRLNPGVTADQFLSFFESGKINDPNDVAPYGAIVLDVEQLPGTEDIQTKLQPGDYVAFDGASDNPADWSHTTFSIEENGSPQKLPAAQQWQQSVDFRFRGTTTLHTGQVVRASNIGWVVHMMDGFQVKNKAMGRKVVKLLRAGNDAKVEKIAGPGFFSLFGPVSHGAVAQFVLHAKPGWYVEACFMDTEDGREHTTLGMERLVHVVK
jgi:hypothetical protein